MAKNNNSRNIPFNTLRAVLILTTRAKVCRQQALEYGSRNSGTTDLAAFSAMTRHRAYLTAARDIANCYKVY